MGKQRNTGELPRREVLGVPDEEPITDTSTESDGRVANLAELVRQWDQVDRWAVTVLQGPAPGRVMAVDGGGTVLGRGHQADLQIDDPKMSRRHARLEPFRDVLRVTDLGSRNGTLVGGQRIRGAVAVADGGLIQCGHTLLRAQLRNAAEVEAARALYESSVRDPLTHLYNRRHLMEHLDSELAYAQRHGSSLSVLLLDLDHFKRVNDRHGHAAGDEVLRRCARMLSQSLRREDLAARLGGEELVVVIRGVGADGAKVMAHRVRADLEDLVIDYQGQSLRVTGSVGVATADAEHPHDSPASLLAAADRCLYRAKHEGRNLVVSDRDLSAERG